MAEASEWLIATNDGVRMVTEDGGAQSVLAAGMLPTYFSTSATEPDWIREKGTTFRWQPSRALLASIRRYQDNSGWPPLRWLRRRLAVLSHRFWSVVTGADIPLNCQIGGGLLIPHPNGVVIHPACEIGPNCLFFQQVTLGAANGGVPQLGGHVDVGAGAKILGPVKVGDHAVVGANAVVICDVPAGATAVGVPARIIMPANGEQVSQ